MNFFLVTADIEYLTQGTNEVKEETYTFTIHTAEKTFTANSMYLLAMRAGKQFTYENPNQVEVINNITLRSISFLGKMAAKKFCDLPSDIEDVEEVKDESN